MTLKSRIVDMVNADGPMPFEQFMEISLYDEEGFFGGNKLRSQKAGDFLTSPEVSRLFGEALAEYVRREHKRIGDPFELVEVKTGVTSKATLFCTVKRTTRLTFSSLFSRAGSV